MPLTFRFVLLIFLLTAETYSQQLLSEKQTDAFILLLQKQKVDSIITFQNACIGCSTIVDLKKQCQDVEEETYIFWKERETTHLTRRDNCNNYKIITLKDNDIWDFYSKHKNEIVNEKIKPPQYVSIKEDSEHIYSISHSHYGYDILNFYIEGNRTEIKLIDYYFIKEIDNKKNINYLSNKESYSNNLRLMLDASIEKNKKKFD